MTAETGDRRLTTIVMADVVGYSRLMSRDEAGTLQQLRDLRRDIVFPKMALAGGRIVKTTGDGMIAEFTSAVRAVECAVAIQQTIAARNAEGGARTLRLRVGINLGDVVADPDGDLYGDGVNVAARLEAAAPPGGLCISRAVHDLVRDKLPYAFEDKGEQVLKNIDRPVGLYQLAIGPSDESDRGGDSLVTRNGETVVADSTSPRLIPGTVLNDLFEIERFIGSGGLGDVYKGRAIGAGDDVAIKTIRPEFASDATTLGLFRREASVLRTLNHDAIVRYFVFSAGKAGAVPYLAMEYVPGQPLIEIIRQGPLSFEQLQLLQHRLASGLQAVHDLGVVHRDISPDNVILPDGRVERAKIIDFGIARSEHPEGTLIGSRFAGKLRYVSPEQLGLFGGQVGPTSDIYSLGLVLAEAALGRSLDMGGDHVQLIGKRKRVPDLSEVDSRLRPLLTRMLQPDPRHRPASMSEVAAWLPVDTSPRRGSGRRLAFAALGLIVLASAIAAFLLVGPKFGGPSPRTASEEPSPAPTMAGSPSTGAPDGQPAKPSGPGAAFETALLDRMRALLPSYSASALSSRVRGYVEARDHKAQAISYLPFGTWRTNDRETGEAAAEKALEGCQVFHGTPCALIATGLALEPLPSGGLDPPRRDMPRATYAGRFDPERIPSAWSAGRQPGDVLSYRSQAGPKAAAYHPWGRVFTIAGAPNQRAAEDKVLADCTADPVRKGADGPCYLYAVGDQVVLPQRRVQPISVAEPTRSATSPDELLAWFTAATPALSLERRQARARQYSDAGENKAQAIAPGTEVSWYVSRRSNPLIAEQIALEACQMRSGQPCVTAAVNDRVQPRPADNAWQLRDMARVRYVGPFSLVVVPVVPDSVRSRADVAAYATATEPKAAAIHPRGLLFVEMRATDQAAAERAALAACNADPERKGEEGPCLLYAQGNQVVLPQRLTRPRSERP